MRKITVLLSLLLISTMAFSQAQFAIGVKGGLNFAKLDVEDFSTKNRTGFHGGAFALVKLTKIGIQPEIIFSQQGSKFSFNGDELESNFNYVNIPIMLKLYTIAGINIQAGPQFGFVTKAEQETIDFNGVKTTQDVKDQFKGSDISLGLGLGWDLPFGLTVDARYNLGLSKIDDDAALNATRNQVFQLSLGYKLIKIGK